jgi:uncharacterized protein YqgC (DUF456 family)
VVSTSSDLSDDVSPWLSTFTFGLTLFVMLVGLFGLVIPIFPGIMVIWLAALGYGLVHGFGTLGGWMFGLITLLMIAGIFVDNVLMGLVARQGGVSWVSIIAGIFAGLIVSLAWTPIGGIFAAPLVLMLSEYFRTSDWKQMLVALRSMTAGWCLGVVARVGLGVVMIILWAVWALNR